MLWGCFTSPSAGAGVQIPAGSGRVKAQGRAVPSLGLAAGAQGAGSRAKSCSTSLGA